MAEPAATASQQAPESIDQAARRQQLEQQKAQVERLNLPPTQTAIDAPELIDLPVAHDDSPGATRK